MVVNIREFTNEFLLQILEIEKSSFKEPWSSNMFKHFNNNHNACFLIAQEFEEIIGYIISIISNFERMGRILNLAVKRNHRRKGVGYLLVYSIIDRYKDKVSKLFLEVRSSNQAAIGLYLKLGFKVDKIIPKYYQDNEDAYLMNRFLHKGTNFHQLYHTS